MKEIKEENQAKPAKEPVFLERGDGLGWTFNFDRPISYVILFLILGISLVICLYAGGVIKL